MHFEVSERLNTAETPGAIMKFTRDQFEKISEGTTTGNGQLTVRMIEASFGSINRSDVTTIELKQVNGGYLLVSETNYRPSGWFWIFLLVALLSYVGWLIPVAFYLYQRGTVKSAIQSSMTRIANEFSVGPMAFSMPTPAPSKADELKKLAQLRDGGVLDEDEFTAQKIKLLRS